MFHVRNIQTLEWHNAWQALDEIEMLAKRVVADGNRFACQEIIDAVQRARGRMTDALKSSS